MSHSLLVLLALIGFARGATVEIDGATWQALQPPEKPEIEVPPPVAADRDVTLTPVEGGLLVTSRWTIRAVEPGWFTGVLIGPGAHVGTVTWNGERATVSTNDEGTAVAGFVNDRTVITLDAFVPAEQVRLLPAVRGLVRLDGGALSADGAPALADGDAFLTGAADLAPAVAPPSGDAGDLILAHVGLGVTVGDSAVAARARVAWVVRRGKLDAVAIRATGFGDDLEVEGPNVASWERLGDTIAITLREPAVDRVDVSLSGSALTPSGTEAVLALPTVEPQGAFRTESTLQIAREEGLEVVPTLDGWQPVASSGLPEWGRDLVIAAPTAAFRAGGVPGGSLALLRFEPLPLPPLVVDVADHRIATTADGRVLARALYEIRNERAPWLRIVPPEGWHIIGIRVSGDTARPVTDGGEGWLVPLPRSVDTVSGLLSFPVEVAFLGEGSPWADAAETTLALPSIDAEVADWRATLFLPPGFKSRMHPGEQHVVEEFAEGEGIVYGVSIGGAKVAEADALFEDAVASWLDNDFEAAQEQLDDLREIGGEGENIDKLQSNLDLVGGLIVTEDYAARQIRSQARARAQDDERAMKELEKKAEERQRAGDYSSASGYYEQALDIGENLQQIEGAESVDIASSNATYRENLEVITKDQVQRIEVLGEAAAATTTEELPWNVEGNVGWDTTGEVAWDVDGAPEWAPPPETPAESPYPEAAPPVAATSPDGGAYWYDSPEPPPDDSYDESETLSVNEVARMPLGRSYQRSVQSMPGSAGGGRRGERDAKAGRGSGGGDAQSIPSAVATGGFDFEGLAIGGAYHSETGPMVFVPDANEALPDPEVHASALSITVPEVGESIRFQRRLVPAEETPALDIDAKITIRERRNS